MPDRGMGFHKIRVLVVHACMGEEEDPYRDVVSPPCMIIADIGEVNVGTSKSHTQRQFTLVGYPIARSSLEAISPYVD